MKARPGQLGEDEAQRRFEEQATGEAEQAARHGDHIDPDQGRSAYAGDDSAGNDSDGNESDGNGSAGTGPAESDPDSPGATIDDPEPAEPNEPG